ncbi:MAG: glycoside hydrolase family 25 protein [Bacteroidota bacterium]
MSSFAFNTHSFRTLCVATAVLIAGWMAGCSNEPAPATETPAPTTDTTAAQPQPQTQTPTQPQPQPAATTSTSPPLGIDVSHYQGQPNWNELRGDGIAFAFAKATGGLTDTDPEFSTNWSNMKAAGIIRGAYHFYYAADDPEKQADHFLSAITQLQPGDLPPVLDLEEGGVSGTVDKAAYASGVFTWLQKVEKAVGLKPIIYTDPNFSSEYLTDPKFGNYPLWLAEYGPEPHVPTAWAATGWTIWQYTATGSYNGVNGDVDHDKFNGTLDELKAMTKP